MNLARTCNKQERKKLWISIRCKFFSRIIPKVLNIKIKFSCKFFLLFFNWAKMFPLRFFYSLRYDFVDTNICRFFILSWLLRNSKDRFIHDSNILFFSPAIFYYCFLSLFQFIMSKNTIIIKIQNLKISTYNFIFFFRVTLTQNNCGCQTLNLIFGCLCIH